MTIENLITTAKFIDEVIVFNSDHKSLFKGAAPEATKFYGKEEVEEFWVVDHQPNKDPRFASLCIVINN